MLAVLEAAEVQSSALRKTHTGSTILQLVFYVTRLTRASLWPPKTSRESPRRKLIAYLLLPSSSGRHRTMHPTLRYTRSDPLQRHPWSANAHCFPRIRNGLFHLRQPTMATTSVLLPQILLRPSNGDKDSIAKQQMPKHRHAPKQYGPRCRTHWRRWS